VWVNLVVVGDPRWQLVHHSLGVRAGTDADVIAFDGATESLGHSVALRTFDGCRSRFKTDVASERGCSEREREQKSGPSTKGVSWRAFCRSQQI
jgi:hypothetical protein